MATEVPATAPPPSGLSLETRGIEVVDEGDRKGRPRDLFWPWFAANISVLGISYGAFVLAFGVSFWQGVFAAVVGTAFSFLLVGLRRAVGNVGVGTHDDRVAGGVRRPRQRAADGGVVRAARRLGDGAVPRSRRSRRRRSSTGSASAAATPRR